MEKEVIQALHLILEAIFGVVKLQKISKTHYDSSLEALLQGGYYKSCDLIAESTK